MTQYGTACIRLELQEVDAIITSQKYRLFGGKKVLLTRHATHTFVAVHTAAAAADQFDPECFFFNIGDKTITNANTDTKKLVK